MNFKRNLIRVFSANFLSLVSAIIIGFIIPSVLSIENYAYLKTYAFYISYITVFHLGFVDGMYIKYGGKELDNVNLGELKGEHRVLSIFQSIITIVIVIVAVIKRDQIGVVLALSIIPINLQSFHKQFYQATGQFDKYSNISYLYTAIYLGLNLLLVISKSNNYILYCFTTLIANLIICLIVEYRFYKVTKNIEAVYGWYIFNNIKIGFYILIGNFAVIFFYALDRWFVKWFYTIDDFAYYSFAVSMLNIMNTAITAISLIFYNYLCKNKEKEKIQQLKVYLLITGAFASCGYFILAGIINLFLVKYIPSLSIIAISFAGYPYIIVINSIYVNLYKTNSDKKVYIKVVSLMTIVSIIYNCISIVMFNRLEMIAFATTLAFITWYIYSIKDFNFLNINFKESIYLIIITSSFLILSNLESWIIGGILYLILLILLTLSIYKNEVVKILRIKRH